MTPSNNLLNNNNRYFNALKLRGYWTLFTYKTVLKPFWFLMSDLGFKIKKQLVKIYLKSYQHPVEFRHNTSDITVFSQVLVDGQYSCVADLEDPKLIIDCGANVGYSTLYFLNKYPNAHVIAVEPDLENFKLCEKNLTPYAERVSLVRSGIWSHPTGLIIFQEKSEERNEWGIQVKEVQGTQKPDIHATDIYSLLKSSKFTSIDLLKIDIEGAEAIIFSQNYENWLRQVKNIVIELHNDDCKNKFFKAMSNYNYDLSESGELTICKKIFPITTSSTTDFRTKS